MCILVGHFNHFLPMLHLLTHMDMVITPFLYLLETLTSLSLTTNMGYTILVFPNSLLNMTF